MSTVCTLNSTVHKALRIRILSDRDHIWPDPTFLVKSVFFQKKGNLRELLYNIFVVGLLKKTDPNSGTNVTGLQQNKKDMKPKRLNTN